MNTKNDRREFIKKAAYVAPAVLTLSSMPSIAQSGSGSSRPQRPSHGNRPSGANSHGNGQRTRP